MKNLDTKNKLDLRYSFKDNANDLYRDYCCHLNNSGMHLISLNIIKNFNQIFKSYLK